uniref:Uncharacterized protein n=1 Tax=Anguilla anguilla TaxID=7936 RepID=A0A0E9TT77_ANGAN
MSLKYHTIPSMFLCSEQVQDMNTSLAFFCCCYNFLLSSVVNIAKTYFSQK